MSDRIQQERMLTVAQVGAVLGGMSGYSVHSLIRQGLLNARKQRCRGTGAKPRLLIPESELKRYINELEPVNPPAPPPTPMRRRGKLADVIEFV